MAGSGWIFRGRHENKTEIEVQPVYHHKYFAAADSDLSIHFLSCEQWNFSGGHAKIGEAMIILNKGQDPVIQIEQLRKQEIKNQVSELLKKFDEYSEWFDTHSAETITQDDFIKAMEQGELLFYRFKLLLSNISNEEFESFKRDLKELF